MPDFSWRLKTYDLCRRPKPKKKKKFGLRRPQTSLVLSRQEMSGIWAKEAKNKLQQFQHILFEGDSWIYN